MTSLSSDELETDFETDIELETCAIYSMDDQDLKKSILAMQTNLDVQSNTGMGLI